MDEDTFNFFLSPHIDKHYFTSNKPTNFKNFRPQKINLYNNLAAFIRVKKIYIKGISEKNFIVCLDGLAPSFTNSGTKPILAYCSNNIINSQDQYTLFDFENYNHFIPFSLAREENWNISIKTLSGDEIKEDSTTDCIIHLTLRTHFNFDMSLIHKSYFLKLTIDKSNSFLSNHLSPPITIKGSEKIGITDISFPTIVNMRKPFNKFQVSLLDPLINNSPTTTNLTSVHQHHAQCDISFLPGQYKTLYPIERELNNPSPESNDQYKFKMDYQWSNENKHWVTKIHNMSPFKMLIQMKEELASILGCKETVYIEKNSFIIGEKGMNLNATIPKICLLTSPVAKEAYSGNKVFNVLKTFKYTASEEEGSHKQETNIHFDNITFYEASPGEYSTLKFEIRDFKSGEIVHNHANYEDEEAVVSLIVK